MSVYLQILKKVDDRSHPHQFKYTSPEIYPVYQSYDCMHILKY